MERLTKRNTDGSVSQPTDLRWADALSRLADYEDTGLTPEEITTAEKNEPLTVAELRRMVGKPVYLHSNAWPPDCGWCVIEKAGRDEIEFTDGDIFLIADYGMVWLAYRRKPGDNAAPVHKLTNADRIRAMSDEELEQIIMCPYDGTVSDRCCSDEDRCTACCLDWLKQPAEAER